MIIRIWHGWTSIENADAYEKLLKTEVFPGIIAKKIAGFIRIELSQSRMADEVEFITVMWFTSIDHIISFAGQAYETAYVPPAARKILKRFNPKSQHYQVLETREPLQSKVLQNSY